MTQSTEGIDSQQAVSIPYSVYLTFLADSILSRPAIQKVKMGVGQPTRLGLCSTLSPCLPWIHHSNRQVVRFRIPALHSIIVLLSFVDIERLGVSPNSGWGAWRATRFETPRNPVLSALVYSYKTTRLIWAALICSNTQVIRRRGPCGKMGHMSPWHLQLDEQYQSSCVFLDFHPGPDHLRHRFADRHSHLTSFGPFTTHPPGASPLQHTKVRRTLQPRTASRLFSLNTGKNQGHAALASTAVKDLGNNAPCVRHKFR